MEALYQLLCVIPGNFTTLILFYIEYPFTSKNYLVSRYKVKFPDVIHISKVKLVIKAEFLFFSFKEYYSFMVSIWLLYTRFVIG